MKALEILKKAKDRWLNGDSIVIYEDEINEAIKELEELNIRSCKTCTHFKIYKGEYGVCKMGIDNRKLDLLHNSFCCNVFERN